MPQPEQAEQKISLLFPDRFVGCTTLEIQHKSQGRAVLVFGQKLGPQASGQSPAQNNVR